MPDLTDVEQQRVRNIRELFFSIPGTDNNTINTFLLHNLESQHEKDKYLEVMDEFFSLNPHFADDETLTLNDFFLRIKNFVNNQDGKSLIEHFTEVSFPPGAGNAKSHTKTKRRKSKRRKSKRRKTRRKSKRHKTRHKSRRRKHS